MSEENKNSIWGYLVPLIVILCMIAGVCTIGYIGKMNKDKVREFGLESIGSTLNTNGKRMIQVTHNVNGKNYTVGIGKPFRFIQPNEQYKMKYLQEDPESIAVFFDKPILSSEFQYMETTCESISKTLSIVDFEYIVNGKRIKRRTLFRDHKLTASKYKVLYRSNNPLIGYLVEN